MVQGPEDWLSALPPVTRGWLLLCALTTVGCYLDVTNQFQLFFSTTGIGSGQWWRAITCFLYFGDLNINFIFSMFLLVKYCKSLEEETFHGNSSDFLWMLLFGGSLMLLSAPVTGVLILGHSLTSMVVYVWARQHRDLRMSLFGLFNFNAPYFPWVMLVTSVLLGASPKRDLLGIATGHLYFFLQYVLPRIHRRSRGYLCAPRVVRSLFRERGVEISTTAQTVHMHGAAMHGVDAADAAAAAHAMPQAQAQAGAHHGNMQAGHHHID